MHFKRGPFAQAETDLKLLLKLNKRWIVLIAHKHNSSLVTLFPPPPSLLFVLTHPPLLFFFSGRCHSIHAKILHVPYKGGAPALVALLGAQNDVVFSLWPECLTHVKAGKLRALAVTTDTRLAQMPDIPTTAEAGFPSVKATGWQGVMVRAGTPKDIVARINAQVSSIMAAPDMRSRIVEQGFMPVTMGIGETEKFLNADVELWAKIIRDGNIKAE